MWLFKLLLLLALIASWLPTKNGNQINFFSNQEEIEEEEQQEEEVLAA